MPGNIRASLHPHLTPSCGSPTAWAEHPGLQDMALACLWPHGTCCVLQLQPHALPSLSPENPCSVLPRLRTCSSSAWNAPPPPTRLLFISVHPPGLWESQQSPPAQAAERTEAHCLTAQEAGSPRSGVGRAGSYPSFSGAHLHMALSLCACLPVQISHVYKDTTHTGSGPTLRTSP